MREPSAPGEYGRGGSSRFKVRVELADCSSANPAVVGAPGAKLASPHPRPASEFLAQSPARRRSTSCSGRESPPCPPDARGGGMLREDELDDRDFRQPGLRGGWMNARTKLAAALSLAALALVTGCKGDTGPTGPQGPPGPPGPGGDAGGSGILFQVPSNTEAPTDAANAAWAALQPQVTVQSVSVASPPRVTFKVTTASGGPIVGLGNTSLASGAQYPGLTNPAFAIAKLVPSSNGARSRWVSYIVTTVPTLTADGGTTSPGPTRPSTDNTGTLTDNVDGTYVYVFFRDITQTKALVDGMTFTGAN